MLDPNMQMSGMMPDPMMQGASLQGAMPPDDGPLLEELIARALSPEVDTQNYPSDMDPQLLKILQQLAMGGMSGMGGAGMGPESHMMPGGSMMAGPDMGMVDPTLGGGMPSMGDPGMGMPPQGGGPEAPPTFSNGMSFDQIQQQMQAQGGGMGPEMGGMPPQGAPPQAQAVPASPPTAMQPPVSDMMQDPALFEAMMANQTAQQKRPPQY